MASNGADLKKHIKRFRQKDLILIDTPGFNQKNNDQLMELQGYFKKLNIIEIQLVLSATTKEKDLLDTVKHFENIGTSRLIFTRIDESNTVGNILNVLIRSTIPFSYLADGQQIPSAIQAATLEELTTLLLRHDAGSDFWPDSGQNIVHPNGHASEPVYGTRFVANRNSDVYHVAGCKWTKKIKTDHIVTFESAPGAEQQNYLPCKNCNPHRADLRRIEVFDRGRVKVSSN